MQGRPRASSPQEAYGCSSCSRNWTPPAPKRSGGSPRHPRRPRISPLLGRPRQTGTARLLPRLLKGRKAGPVFLTDRRARVQLPPCDIDPARGRVRLSYRQAEDLFKAASGGATLHQLRHSALTRYQFRSRRVDSDTDGQERPHVSGQPGPVRAAVRRGPGPLAGAQRPGMAAMTRGRGSGRLCRTRTDRRAACGFL
jgi:hypothetical protein